MANNKSLSSAKKAKQDEFYTQLSDIENELKHYKKHFKGKTVICNCDDPFESNFTLYFLMNFNSLKLKRLISTGYSTSQIMGHDLPLFNNIGMGGRTYCLDIKSTKEFLKGEQTDLDSETAKKMLRENRDKLTYLLKGDGDFRSEESVGLLKQADIVVGNPPFSLFRQYVAQLMKHKKNFLIIGNQNNVTYKEIFPLIKDGKMWLGYGFNAGNAYFKIPEKNRTEYAKGVYDEKTKLVKFRNCHWFTNLDHKKRHELFRLGFEYKKHESMYPRYDNYDAIDIGKDAKNGKRVGDSSMIPYDYDGVMGVSVTWLDKFCPEQFEIIGNEYSLNIEKGRGYINGKRMYGRIFIKAKQPGRNDWDAWQKEIDGDMEKESKK